MSQATSFHEEIPPVDVEQPAPFAGPKLASQPLFSSEEWETMHIQDRQAAAAFAGILTGCYTIGLIIALIVFYSCL